MCKYGMLKRKDPMEDELTYVDNPVESGFPGHWLPLSILKKVLEMRVQTPTEFTETKVVKLKLYKSIKYIKTSPYVKDITSTVKTTKITTDKAIEPPAKVLFTMSQIPSQESFATFTTRGFNTPVTLSVSAVTKDKLITDTSQLSSTFTKIGIEPKTIETPAIPPAENKTIQKSTYAPQLPSESSKLITEFKTFQNTITEEDVSEKTVMESKTVLTTEYITNNKVTSATTTSIILSEMSPELSTLSLTTMKTTPFLSTKMTTDLNTTESEKLTAELKTATTASLTDTPTTELTTEVVTTQTTKEPTKEVNESTQLKEILTTGITTSTTTTETGNPFY